MTVRGLQCWLEAGERWLLAMLLPICSQFPWPYVLWPWAGCIASCLNIFGYASVKWKLLFQPLFSPDEQRIAQKFKSWSKKKKSFGKWFSNLCHLCSHATSSLSKLTVFHLLYGSSPTGPWDSTLVPNMPVLYTARTAFQKYNHLTLLLKMPPKTSHRHSQN